MDGPSNRAAWIRNALKAAFGALVVALLLWRVDLHGVRVALASYRWPWLVATVLVFAASWALAAARWKLFVRESRYARLLELTLIGQFYALVFPGQIAGEVVKAYRLAKGNADAERLAATVLLDRILGLIALLLVASVGLLLSRNRLPEGLGWFFAGLTLVLVCSLVGLRLDAIHRAVGAVIRRLELTRLRKPAASLHRAVDAWRGFSTEPLRLAASLALGVLFQLLGVAGFAILAANLGIVVSGADWAWIYGVVSLAILLPVSIGGIGLREGALVGCLGFLGISPERALALSFGVFGLTLVGAVSGGILEMIEVTRKRASSLAR